MSQVNVRDGEYVKCGNCGRQAKVRIFDPGKVALLGPDAMLSMRQENIALKCQDCGYIVCFACASSQTGPVGIPTCPSCKKEGGPYFFTVTKKTSIIKAPCPYCGRPLRTAKAKQCFSCHADWHDPDNVVRNDVGKHEDNDNQATFWNI